MKKRGFLAIVLALSTILSLLPVNYAFAAGETGDFTVSGGTLGTDYSYSDNVLTVLKSTKLTISGTTTADRIVVANGVKANLVLSNLSITTGYTNNSDNSPLSLKDAGESVITLQGDNTLDGSGAGNYAPGIFVPNGSLLTINGTGRLTAKGSGNWPGIGRHGNGNLKIESGEITAIGGQYGAGIGGSYGHNGGNITINGGTIIANGGQYADGIGCGREHEGGNTTISGGTITATSGAYWNGNFGIGGTFTTGTNGNAFIITNSIENTGNSADWSGAIIIGNSGKVYGNPTIATDAEIPSGKTLTIESGMSMTVDSGVTLTNNGNIIVNDGGLLTNNGTVEGRGTITNDGKVVNNNSIVCKGNIKRNGTLENSGEIELIFDTNDIVFDGEVTIPSGITVTNEGKFYIKDSCTLTINGKLNNQGEILCLRSDDVPDNLVGNQPVALFVPEGKGTPSTVNADGANVTITDDKITINHSKLGTTTEPLDPDSYIFEGSTGSLNITVSQPLQLTLDNATIVTALNQMMSVNGVVNINLIGENTIGFNKKDGDRGSKVGISMTDNSEIHFSTETDGSVTIMGNYNYWWDAPAAVKGGNLYVESGTVTAIGGGTTYGPANGGSVGKAFNGKTLTVNGGTFNGCYQTGSCVNGNVTNSGTAVGETLAETITVAEGAVLNTNYRSLGVDSAEISLTCTAGQTADLPSATVTISNSGNLKSQSLQAQENSKLNVAFSKNEIDAGGSITATVTPKGNLTAGEYTEVITVQGSNNEITTFTVKLKVKEKITFEVSGTEQVYKAGEAKTITFVPSALSADDFVVKYYEVDENNGVLKSTNPVSRAIASGCYMYVIDLAGEQEDYGIGRKFTVTDTTIPDISAYDNVGYMYINTTAEQQKPIYFASSVINAHITDTITNPLTNPNASTVTYESKNTSVAKVNSATGEVTIMGAGSAVIVATSTKTNTSDVYASYTLNVTKEVVTVTATSPTVEYGTEADDIPHTYSVSKAGITLGGTAVYTTAYTNGSGCGQYSVEISGLTSDIYDITFVPGTLTVTPKTLTLADLDITAKDKAYDGSDKAEITASVKDTALVSGDIVSVLAQGTFDNANASDSDKNVSYTVTGLSGTHSGNYTLTGTLTGTAAAKITKAPVTVSVPATTTYVYDGEDKSVNAVAYANGIYFDKFNVTYNGSTDKPKNVGTYTVGVEITDSNYVLSGDISAQFIIREAQQDFFSIEGVADTVTYGDAPFNLQADGVDAGSTVKYSLISGDAVTVTEDGLVTITGVGSVKIQAKSTLANHTEKTAARTFTVKPKTLNVTASPKVADKVYDGTKTVDVTLSLDGVVPGDDVTASFASAAVVSADVENNKTVFVNGITLSGADTGKYQLASQSVQTSVNVTKRQITAIAFTAKDKVYDENAKADYTITNLDGVLDDDKAFVTVIGSAEFSNANAGTSKTVTLSGLTLSGTKSGNYELNVTGDVTAQASISKAKVEFTLGTLEYTYDGTEKTVPVTAAVDGEAYTNYTVAYQKDGSAAETVNAGEYDVVITLGDTTNYETDYTPKTLKIVKASQSAITITGLIGTIDYGAVFALSAVGGNGDGAVTWQSSDSNIAEVDNTGVVAIKGTGSPVMITATKAGDENFGGEQTAAVTFTPIKKSVGFKVTNLNQIYDGSAKSVTVAPSVGSENFSITYTDEKGDTVDAPTNAGIYYADVHATGHYDGYTTAVLTIKNAAVNTSGYTFNVADAVYGSTPVVTQPESTEYPSGAEAKVTYTGSGIYSETTEQPKNAGSYTAILTISGDNYETVRLTDSFVITKAVLTAKPDNASRSYGEQNPVFTVSYSGFVNGDDESAVMIAPSMTTNATVSSGTGTYPIKASGGYAENYTFSYVDGTLTVVSATGGNFYIHGGQSNPYVGNKFTLTAYYNNEKPTVEWSSDNTAVATVNAATGEVEIVGSGTATITAKMNDSRFDSTLTAEFTLTAVYLPETQSPIYFDSLLVEKYVTDGAFTNPAKGMSDGASVKYTSSNTEVAAVDETSGEVTIHKAGTAVIKATSTKFNCADVFASYTLTVKKAPITVSAKDITLTYGESFTATDITISGGVTTAELSGTLAFTTKYAVGKSVGEYEVTPNGLTSDTYDITFESGTIIVTEKTLNAADFEIAAANKGYDGTNTAEISAVVKTDALVGADNLRAEVSGHFADANAEENKTVSYEITSLSGKGFENYVLGSDVNTTNITASITPAKVTFFVSEETTRIYDGTVQKVDISAMALGNVFGESNYIVYYQADGEEKTTEPKNAGEYTVTVELTDKSGNYEAIQPTAKLVIEVDAAANLYISGSNKNVTVDDVFKLYAYYGNQTPEVAWTSSDEDVAEVNSTTGEVTILKAGTATITATVIDTNYNGESAEFELEAAKKRINIKTPAGELVKTYNGERQDINFTSSDIDLEEKNVTVNAIYVLLTDSSVTEPKRVGTYTVSYELNDDRYTADGNVTLTINKANVIVKAKNISKEYGDEPEYELEIVLGGNVTDVAEMTALAEFASEGAEKTANVGTYDITVTLASNGDENRNFIVSDEKGTLTVTKAPLTITVKNVSREYGAENPALEVEYTGFKNEETKDVLTGELVLIYDESINVETAVGSYSGKTTASGLSSDNYDITFVPGNVAVTKIGVKASAGTSRSSYLTVKLDKAVPGLTANNFVVRSGDENIALTEVTASSDNKTYTLKGSFSTSVTYTVGISLEGTESDATHEIISEALSIKPSSGSTGGGGGGGGGSVATTYTVTFETNGGNKIDSVKVSKNGILSKPTEPTKEGFDFDGWYTDKALKTVYDFDTKVAKSFTLYAKWTEKVAEPDKPTEPTEPTAPEWKNPFTDVSENDWFFESVKYANENGLMGGTTNTSFAPNEPLTRGMLVTILYRADGEPAVNKSIPFSDVAANAYYANATIWAQQNGIVNGVTENAFAPDDNITREQIAAIMFRYAKYKGYDVSVGEDTNILSYTDAESISEYAIASMQYAVGSGLMKGKSDSTINPLDNATRAEVAAILQRFIETNK